MATHYTTSTYEERINTNTLRYHLYGQMSR